MGIDVCAHLPGKGTTAVWVSEAGTFSIMLPWVVGLSNKILFPGLTAGTVLAEGQSPIPGSSELPGILAPKELDASGLYRHVHSCVHIHIRNYKQFFLKEAFSSRVYEGKNFS